MNKLDTTDEYSLVDIFDIIRDSNIIALNVLEKSFNTKYDDDVSYSNDAIINESDGTVILSEYQLDDIFDELIHEFDELINLYDYISGYIDPDDDEGDLIWFPLDNINLIKESFVVNCNNSQNRILGICLQNDVKLDSIFIPTGYTLYFNHKKRKLIIERRMKND